MVVSSCEGLGERQRGVGNSTQSNIGTGTRAVNTPATSSNTIDLASTFFNLPVVLAEKPDGPDLSLVIHLLICSHL